MKIAVNTRLLLRGKLDGIGWFTHEIMKRIVLSHPEHEFHFLFDRPFSDEFIFAPNVQGHVVGPQARHPWLFRVWYNWMVPRKLKQLGVDVFISPDMMLSLRATCKQIVVLHDLNFEHYPEDLPSHISRYLRSQTPLFAQRAASIITVSEYSKRDIQQQYGTPASKIEVVYNAPQDCYRVIDAGLKQRVMDEYTQGKPYFVFISSIHPRKNLQRLLLAYDAFRSQTGSDVKLVAVGRRFWKNEVLDETLRAMKYREDVIFTGHLERDSLRDVLAAARALVYVSYFEGFGVPIVEAFRSGVPVITSNVTSMPEVAGDAALLVNPFSIEDMSAAMDRIFCDEDLRASLIQRGISRASLFNWDESASRFWKIIERTVSNE
jgi:glycosyltransferase involved in cell wall biosynthesis